jgi:OFA family oxalate/formate antiporter-like MFS transporter
MGNRFGRCVDTKQVLLFWLMPSIGTVTSMTVLTFVVLMCYGGGFGTMPAFAADYFGSKNVGPIYGLMLTAWGTASAVGPLLIAQLRQTTGSYHRPLHVIAVVRGGSALLPILISPPHLGKRPEAGLRKPGPHTALGSKA